jgi:hypothetical protein
MNAVLRLATEIRAFLLSRGPKYISVGIVNTVFGYLAFAVMNYMTTPIGRYNYILAGLASHVFSVTFSYFMYWFYIFDREVGFILGWRRAQIAYGLSALPGLVAMIPAVELAIWLGCDEVIASYLVGAVFLVLQLSFSILANIGYVFSRK